MTTQAANANLNKNQFGDGAKISINVSNSSRQPNIEKVKTQSIALEFRDRDSDSDTEKQMTLTKWLSVLHLDNIYNKLKELGVEETEDMTLLDEEDFESLHLKKIQMKKLRRAILAIE